MEFWGLEVKAGQSVMVDSEDGMILHITQACLGEHKKEKGNEQVLLYANKDGKKFLLGRLSADKFPNLSLDLLFEDKFELSHSWKRGSVHFAGYRSIVPSDAYPQYESDEEEEEVPVQLLGNGKPDGVLRKPVGKEGNSAVVKQVKIAEPSKGVKDEDSDESEDDDSADEDSGRESEEEDDDDEDMSDEDLNTSSGFPGEESDDDSDGSVEDDEMEVEYARKKLTKAEPSKKRPAEAPAKTPASDKKVKLITPQKTDGKKVSGHVATPHPSKQAGKPAADKPKQQTPKSGGSFSCSSCSKTFTSEQGLQSHSKAKHG